MDKTQLKNFVALAHALNFSSVARQQFISQPALTNQISKLESELGVQLFHRTKHGVSLTYAGTEFYNYASEILDNMEQAERRMSDIGGGRMGFLNISCVTGNDYQMVKYVEEFNRRYEDINIGMDSGTGIKQIMAINKKSFDVYFSFSTLLRSSGTLEVIDLEPNRYAVYISKKLLPGLSANDLSPLKDLTNLVENRSEGPFLASQAGELMESLGLGDCKTMNFPSCNAVLMAVQSGLGFAVLPSTMNMNSPPQDIAVIPIPGDNALIPNAVAWHKDSGNVVVQKFIDVIKEMNEAHNK